MYTIQVGLRRFIPQAFPIKEYYSYLLKRLWGIQGRKGYCECFMIPPEQLKQVKSLEEL